MPDQTPSEPPNQNPTLGYTAPKPLDYEIPVRQPSLWLALLLCAPGAASFALFFGIQSPFAIIADVFGGLFWPLWFLAIATALVSLCLYIRFPFRAMHWYVIVNLIINIVGLLFSMVMLGPVLWSNG